MKLLHAGRSSKPKLTVPSCNNVDFYRLYLVHPPPWNASFSLHLPYTESYPFCLFNMLYFLWNIYSIQSVVISYLWAHNYFGCTFHRGALILWFSLYLFMYYLTSLPQCIFLLFYYFVFYLVNYNPSNRPPYLFAPTQFLNWNAKF